MFFVVSALLSCNSQIIFIKDKKDSTFKKVSSCLDGNTNQKIYLIRRVKNLFCAALSFFLVANFDKRHIKGSFC